MEVKYYETYGNGTFRRKSFTILHRNFHESLEDMQQLGGLRMWILHVLDEEGPKNGVEIMDAVQVHTERSDRVNRNPHLAPRNTRPLPGSIYPMLKKMVSENLITKREDGRYELTKNGENLNSKLRTISRNI